MATRKPEPPPAEPTGPSPTYEQARDELIAIVARLESGDESLADSMALFRRGEELARLCEQYLTDAKEVVEQAQAALPAPQARRLSPVNPDTT